jgi:hypothetical protein
MGRNDMEAVMMDKNFHSVKNLFQCVVLVAAFLSTSAFAELDPELATASRSATNDSGLFLSGNIWLGQSQAVKISRPGLAAIVGGEIGYSLAQDSWARLQGGAFVGTGMLNFKSKDSPRESQTVSIGLMPILRGAYGYSLGNGAMMLWRAGAGGFVGHYATDIGDVEYKTSSMFPGLVGQLGAELLMSSSSWFEVIVGVDFTHYSFEVDEIKGGGNKLEVDRSFNVNSPTVNLGLKLRL